MLIWGGETSEERNPGSPTVYLGDGARYDPIQDVWSPMEANGAPRARVSHVAVWTGEEMLIWGGYGRVPGTTGSTAMNDGARYAPHTDTWVPMSREGAPSLGNFPRGVWTGEELIVWSRPFAARTHPPTGARYDPRSDTWSLLVADPAIPGWLTREMVWTGSEVVLWGEPDSASPSGRGVGARWDPQTDQWNGLTWDGAPGERWEPAMLAIDEQVLIWGGSRTPADVGDRQGAIYDLTTEAWTPISVGLDPAPRDWPTASTTIWTGHEAIYWGSRALGRQLQFRGEGAAFDPLNESWRRLPLAPLAARGEHTVVWTGTELIVYGGRTSQSLAGVNDGARYLPPC
jgi:hypothetical protein